MIFYNTEIIDPSLEEYFLELLGQKIFDIGVYEPYSLFDGEIDTPTRVQAKAMIKENIRERIAEGYEYFYNHFGSDISIKLEKQEILIGKILTEDAVRIKFDVTEDDVLAPRREDGELMESTRYCLVSAKLDPEYSNEFINSLLNQTVSGIDLIHLKLPAEVVVDYETDREFWEYYSGIIFHLESGPSFAVGNYLADVPHNTVSIMDAKNIIMKFVSEIIPMNSKPVVRKFSSLKNVNEFFKKFFAGNKRF